MRMISPHVVEPEGSSLIRLSYLDSGIAWAPIDQISAQGFDIQFGTNILGKPSLLVNPPRLSLGSNARTLFTR
jgi:hypothetical protein